MAGKKKIKITQVRSVIGRSERQKRTMRALGLRRIRHSVVHNDTLQIRGMINKVAHLVELQEVR
ncbi:MAG: 50S ribosomal protein L30 [bacterium]